MSLLEAKVFQVSPCLGIFPWMISCKGLFWSTVSPYWVHCEMSKSIYSVPLANLNIKYILLYLIPCGREQYNKKESDNAQYGRGSSVFDILYIACQAVQEKHVTQSFWLRDAMVACHSQKAKLSYASTEMSCYGKHCRNEWKPLLTARPYWKIFQRQMRSILGWFCCFYKQWGFLATLTLLFL